MAHMSDIPEHARVPGALRTAAAWSWRILVVLALSGTLVFLVIRLQVLFVAIFVAFLATAVLAPIALRLRAAGVRRGLATAIVMVGALVVFGLIMYWVGRALFSQADEFAAAISAGIEKVRAWMTETFGTSLDELLTRASEYLSTSGGEGGLTSSVFGAAATAIEILSGAGIALFATIFFVHDGDRIWHWVTRLFPTSVRGHIDDAGRLSWRTLAAYARGTILIAAIDAIGIGAGVALVGVPLAGPITVLVFFGAFIPIVGAFVSGFVAVIIALATVGVTGAVAVLVIVIVVQQVEGHILQPLIQGRMVRLHPLAVVLAVAGGSILGGLIGAVVAVPIVSVANVLIRYAASFARSPEGDVTVGVPPDEQPAPPAPVDPTAPA